MDGVHDAAGVAGGARRDVAGVHQQRLARGRDEEGGVAALDVDDVDVEGFALRGGGRGGERDCQQDYGECFCVHDGLREGAAAPSLLTIGACEDATGARWRRRVAREAASL